MRLPRPILPFAALALSLVPRAQDPEASPEGRTHYLGRAIAQTMHWTGAGWLLRATREAEENGALLQRWLAVAPGQTVADLGCGNGYHTLPLARAAGPTGRVFGVELQPQYLTMLQQRTTAAGLTNVLGIAATLDDPKLPVGSCDLVLMVDVYHELSHPVRVMQRVREALRSGGRVVLVEFRAEDPEVPIKPEHTMTKAQMRRELASHGFRCTDEFDALPWQHAMAFVPAPDDARLAARETLRGALAAAAGDDPRVLVPFLADGAKLSAPLDAQAPIVLRRGLDDSLAAEVAGRNFVLRTDAAGRIFVAPAAAAPWRRPHGSTRAFYAMHTGTGGGPVADQASMVGELGFDGLAHGLDELAAARLACEQRGLDLGSAYAVLTLPAPAAAAPDAAVPSPWLEPLRRALAELAGCPGQLWLALRHEGLAPRDPRGEAAALAALRSLVAEARVHNVAIALYPHHDFWLETSDDALRLAAAVDAPQLGVCFNLCHHLRTGSGDPVAALRRVAPRLLAVTVHGADAAGRDWSTLIRPLDTGDFDLRPLLAALDEIGFAGPVGLQGFGVPGPARDHLTRSMAAWRSLHAAAEPARR
ncbi:MAG: methyltransferase domain-containing protein [Planctomycetes bacterium]|nr:methyltransferase domain-containing protein [Planctomycetota bacterium]